MKAFVTFTGDSPMDGCLLVFHETVNKARKLAHDSDFSLDCEYIDVRAWRRPKWDIDAIGKPRVLFNNDGLHKPFYIEGFQDGAA